MTLSINQILVFCLIAVLIAFVVVLAIMAKHAIELIKKGKGLVETGGSAVEDVKARANNLVDGLSSAASSISDDAGPAVKALAGVAAGLTAINSVSAVGKGLALKSGIMAAIAGNRSAKKAKKDIKRSKRTIKQMKKQAKVEKLAMKQSAALEKKAAKAEMAAARADARLEKRVKGKNTKQAMALAKDAAKKDLKALNYEKKLAKKLRKAQKRAERKGVAHSMGDN